MSPSAPKVTSSPEALARWLTDQRWFDRTGTGDVGFTEPVALPTDPNVGVRLAQATDGHRYQLVVPTTAGTAGSNGDTTATDLATAPEAAAALVELAARNATAKSPAGTLRGHWLDDEPPPGDGAGRVLGADQSNTSVAVGGTHVLKVLRRLAVGVHPEVEVGRHLHAVATEHPEADPLPVAPLSGWYELDDADGTTTLGVVNRLVPGALDGWGLALSALAADPGGLLQRLRELGVAVARLHGALAEPSTETFGRTTFAGAHVDEVATGTAHALGQLAPAVTAPAAARLTERVQLLASDLARHDLGAAIRSHGDLHLGQTVVGADGWVILDFEGEPARPLEERRRRQSPLRDVAGLLRSLSYAAETVRRSGSPVAEGWEPGARAAVLDGYLTHVDPTLLPSSAATTRQLIALFELEKAVYEVGYELAHRPDWVSLPLTALERI